MQMNVSGESLGGVLRESLILEAHYRHLTYHPPADLSQWQTWRLELLTKIRRAAGTFPSPPPLHVQVHGVIAMAGYELRKISYQSRPGLRVTAHLAVPSGRGPFPAVLGLHGHWHQGKVAARVQERTHVLASCGFVVLTVDAFGAGERGTEDGKFEYHGGGIGAALFDVGETLLGMQLYDNLRGIDLLCSLDCVNADAIGVTGASGGGNQTMWVAAMDARVKAAVPVVSVGTFESYVMRSNCMCEVLPDGLTFMEEWAVLGLIAPNALLMLNSLQDGPTFLVSEMIRSFNIAREIYRLYGASEKIAYQAIDLPHGYWPEMQRAMLGWFRFWLKGEGNGRPCELPAIKTLPESEALCFAPGCRPKAVASIVEFAGQAARRLADAHLAGRAKISRAAKARQLRQILRVPEQCGRPDVSSCVAYMDAGMIVRKQTVKAPTGALLPVVWLLPADCRVRRALLAVHPRGKSVLNDSVWLKRMIKSGAAVIMADLSGMGEVALSKKALVLPDYHDHLRACYWLGRTIIGDWVAELTILAQWLSAAMPGLRPELLAFEEAALAALSAAALSRSFAGVTTVGMPATLVWGRHAPRLSLAAHVPGMLQWGDVSMLAAMCANELELVDPVNAAGKSASAPERRALGYSIRRLAARLGVKAQISVFDAKRRALYPRAAE